MKEFKNQPVHLDSTKCLSSSASVSCADMHWPKTDSIPLSENGGAFQTIASTIFLDRRDVRRLFLTLLFDAISRSRKRYVIVTGLWHS